MNATAPRLYYAGFISRAIAFLFDLIVMTFAILAAVAVVDAVLGFFTLYGLVGAQITQSAAFRDTVEAVIALIGAAIAIGYPVGCWTLLGQTPGKLLMGVHVTRSDGQPLTLRRSLLRYLGYWLSAIPLGLGFFWVLVDDQRRGWHDHLADTCVVYEARDPALRPTARRRLPA